MTAPRLPRIRRAPSCHAEAMDTFIYFWGGLVLVTMAVLFLPVFLFLAAIYGVIAIAALLF